MFNLSCYEINSKAGDGTDADGNCDNDGTTAAAAHAFKRIHTANKKLKPVAKRRTISNKLGPKQTYSTANNDDNNFNSRGNDIDSIADERDTATLATTTTTQLDIHFLWIFVRDLLRNLVSTSDTIEHIEHNTDQNFEFLTHNNDDFDSIDDSHDFLATIHNDGDLNADDYFEKQKLLKRKLLGNFKSIFPKHSEIPILPTNKKKLNWSRRSISQSIKWITKCPKPEPSYKKTTTTKH